MLDVGSGNCLYWATYGNPDGMPAVILHGGPGSGYSARSPRFLTPRHTELLPLINADVAKAHPMRATLQLIFQAIRPHICWVISNACADIQALNYGWYLATPGAARVVLPMLWKIATG